MDRFTWGFVGGALALCALAIGSVFLVRAAPPPSPSTPAGVVAAFVKAVRARDADGAWDLLSPSAIVGPVSPALGSRSTSRDTFRAEVEGLPSNGSASSRVRILQTTGDGDTTRVTVEVTTTTGGPAFLGGEYSRTLTFGLRQVDGAWKIVTAPAPYEIG